MDKVRLADVAHSPHPRGVTTVRRLVGAQLGTEHLDVTYYEIDPGDQFAGAYHRHLEREELFLVRAGTATFQTEDGPVAVDAGQGIHFAPGEWQLGRNDGSERVVALLIGAPKPLAPVEAYLHCPECESETRWLVHPEEQRSGESVDERKACTRCGCRDGNGG